MTTSTDGTWLTYGKTFRFDDKHVADSLEAEADDLRDRARYETGRELEHTLDEIAKIERVLCQMCC